MGNCNIVGLTPDGRRDSISEISERRTTVSDNTDVLKRQREDGARAAIDRLAKIADELKALMDEAEKISETFEIEFHPAGLPNSLYYGVDDYYGDSDWTWMTSSSHC